jgi:hypothetical protein
LGREILHIHMAGMAAGMVVISDEDRALIILVDQGGQCNGEVGVKEKEKVVSVLDVIAVLQPAMVSDSTAERALERWRRVLVKISVPPSVMTTPVVDWESPRHRRQVYEASTKQTDSMMGLSLG